MTIFTSRFKRPQANPLLQAYHQAVADGVIIDDPLQYRVLEALEVTSEACTSLWRRWQARRSLYIYGPVGVGKTYLMDLFYTHCPVRKKARYHFHQFMQSIDAQLRAAQGQKNPLKTIAIRLANEVDLLCLDEFYVNDVVDASVLVTLLACLFKRGVVLVATSNTPIDDLYRHGVHRERFLPAIALLNQQCRAVALMLDKDYRMGRAPSLKNYLSPMTPENREKFEQQWLDQGGKQTTKTSIEILNRRIDVCGLGQRMVWFNADVIVSIPRCTLDYLAIAKQFDTVWISGLCAIEPEDVTRVTQLMSLIDVLYDRGIRLFVLATVGVQQIYPAGPLLRPFARTLSRLEEMQSQDYAQRHRLINDA